ncbi:MAG: ABC transporter ATP-binding protein, partial [Pseudomonadota bacterium]
MEPLLKLEGVSKRFGETVAADQLSLDVGQGEIHAILGENGAGKSTLMKIIYGVLSPDAGSVSWKGNPVTIASPSEARSLGIGMVFQHFSLFETLTVAENIALSNDRPVGEVKSHIAEVGVQFGLDIAPDALVHSLSMGERQRVEIIRALLGKPDLIIMDEPTSVLPPTAIPGLFKIVRELTESGCSVLFISHKLSEIRELCHRATVMRRGKVVATVNPAETSEAELAKLMIGRDIPHPRRGQATLSDAPILSVRNLSLASDDPFGISLADVSLDVFGGEIVGIAGISGNGQRLLTTALSGEAALAATDSGEITLFGTDVRRQGCEERRAAGLAYVPEDRQGRGAVPELSLTENAILTGHRLGLVRNHMIDRKAARSFSETCIAEMDVRCSGTEAEARSLSGGNLQKFIVGRELGLSPRLMIAAQPTWGVDVGAAQVILQRLVDLRDQGVGCLVISDELEDLLDVADRIHVMFRGRLSPSITRADASDEVIGAYMAGSFADAEHA